MPNSKAYITRRPTMTLKEIADLLEVPHSNAVRVLEEMVKNHGFGKPAKIQRLYNMPNGWTKTITTYELNKRQSIAIAAKLIIPLFRELLIADKNLK